MRRLPPGVWSLRRIIAAVSAENPDLTSDEINSRSREIFNFMLRDADRWFSSGKRLYRLRGLYAGATEGT